MISIIYRQELANQNIGLTRPGLKQSKDKRYLLAEDGEDTSHDAGDLNSQTSNEDPLASGKGSAGKKKQPQAGFVNFNRTTKNPKMQK